MPDNYEETQGKKQGWDKLVYIKGVPITTIVIIGI